MANRILDDFTNIEEGTLSIAKKKSAGSRRNGKC
jgi:hypothetical protein